MNVLVVTAHHDDLELGCGGTVARLLEKGHQVISLVMTHSGYKNSAGEIIRHRDSALEEGMRAASLLGYRLISLHEDTFDIEINDRNICEILQALQEHEVDTVFTHWHGDPHPPHNKVNKMVLHATRNIASVFGFEVNRYFGSETFSPRLFVSLDETHWIKKMEALRCYQTEYARAGDAWAEYIDRQTLNYGMQMGVERAEGFVVYKSLWNI